MNCSIPGFPVLYHLSEFVQTHVHWVGDAIQPSHPPSPPSPSLTLSQHQGLFQWVNTLSGSQSIVASASASVLPVNIQGRDPLGLTSLISLLPKGLSRVFSSTTVQKHQFFGDQPSSRSNFHICTWLMIHIIIYDPKFILQDLIVFLGRERDINPSKPLSRPLQKDEDNQTMYSYTYLIAMYTFHYDFVSVWFSPILMSVAWHRCLLTRKVTVNLENFNPRCSMEYNSVLRTP